MKKKKKVVLCVVDIQPTHLKLDPVIYIICDLFVTHMRKFGKAPVWLHHPRSLWYSPFLSTETFFHCLLFVQTSHTV